MDFSPKYFKVSDYVVFACMLLVSTAIGVYFMIKDRRKQNVEEYLLGGRSMSAYPVAFSLSVSFMSAVLVLGTPAEVYKYGTIYIWITASFLLMSITTAEIYIPIFYNMKLTSVYEYLEKRFNRILRIEGTLLYMLQTILYIGIVIYAPALALNAVTGFNLWGAVIATGIVCIVYSTLGGLKAVIWTDAFQAVVMLVGFLSVIIRGSVVMGGIENIWRKCEEGGRIQLWKFNLDPRERSSIWSITFGSGVVFVALYAVNQGQVQRYLSCRSVTEAKKSIMLNVIGLIILNVFALLCGLVLYAYYQDCDPIMFGVVKESDQLLPYMVLDIFQNYPGVPGLFIACVYSGSLSTISTAITALASVTVEDFLKPIFTWNERTYTWVSRGLVVFYGVVCILFAYFTSTLGQLLQAAVSVVGLVGGPLLGLYTLGILFPFVNSVGAFVGTNAGVAAAIWIFVGSRRYPAGPEFIGVLSFSTADCPFEAENATSSMTTARPTMTSPADIRPPEANLYAISHWYYSIFGFCCTIGVGLLASIITCGWRSRKSVDPLLIYPFFDHWIFQCLPKNIKRFMRCGIPHESAHEDTVSDKQDVELCSVRKLDKTHGIVNSDFRPDDTPA